MTTTFQSRELVRDELVALFQANNTWNNVYGYFPSSVELVGKTPVLVIRSRGTRQNMAGAWTNPASYRFILTNFVAIATSTVAEDELDTLDMTLRQVIRNNAGLITTGDNLRFGDEYSDVSDVDIGGKFYLLETHTIYVDLPSGSKP
jgi:hypothetical protein